VWVVLGLPTLKAAAVTLR
jgi:hypothetical protein